MSGANGGFDIHACNIDQLAEHVESVVSVLEVIYNHWDKGLLHSDELLMKNIRRLSAIDERLRVIGSESINQ